MLGIRSTQLLLRQQRAATTTIPKIYRSLRLEVNICLRSCYRARNPALLQALPLPLVLLLPSYGEQSLRGKHCTLLD